MGVAQGRRRARRRRPLIRFPFRPLQALVAEEHVWPTRLILERLRFGCLEPWLVYYALLAREICNCPRVHILPAPEPSDLRGGPPVMPSRFVVVGLYCLLLL